MTRECSNVERGPATLPNLEILQVVKSTQSVRQPGEADETELEIECV